jgi:hypothetical protein
MFAERDYSSSEVISLIVKHVVALLKSYVPDVDPELLHKEYRCKDDRVGCTYRRCVRCRSTFCF